MPNWCSNIVTLRHEDPEMITRAREGFAKGELLQTFIPCPQDLRDTMAGSYGDAEQQAELLAREEANLKNYGARNWYDWCVANWGTKWDIGDANGVSECTDNVLIVSFDSAWSPPLDAFATLVDELDFDVEAYYYEPGMAFAGSWVNGADHCVEIPSTSAEAERVVPRALDEMFSIVENMAMWEDEEEA